MSFPRPVRDEALSRCQRFCCICHIFCSFKMECHHIVQPKDGGDDSLDNCIPLCLDCHADVKAYNTDHPKGTSYSASELKKHREWWYNFCANNHVSRDAANRPIIEINFDKAQLRDCRLKARNILIKFVDFCIGYPTIHDKKSLNRTQEFTSELMRIKDAIEMLGPLSITEFAEVYASVITNAWQLQRLLDRQGGANPKPIDSRFEIVEDNIGAIIEDLSSMRQAIKNLMDPYLSLEDNSNNRFYEEKKSFLEKAPEGISPNVSNSQTSKSVPDPRKVFVVHGRDEPLRRDFFAFLRALDLQPLEWSEAVRLTGKGSPYIGDVLDRAFDNAQAVIVLLSPDDEVRLIRELWLPDEEEDEKEMRLQARPNVLFEAGMAFGRNADRTLLVEIGRVKRFSDIAGRHVIRFNNSSEKRKEVAERLITAGCAVDTSSIDWLKVGDFTLKRNGNEVKSGEQDSEASVKWVDINYPRDSGLEAKLQDDGFRLRWCSDNLLARRLDIEGWAVVTQEGPSGQTVVMKIKDKPHNQTLIMKREEDSLVIHSATYGTDILNRDVTDRLRHAVAAGRVQMWVDNRTFGPDPSPGVVKRLTVSYSYQGKDYTKTFSEGEFLNLPESNQGHSKTGRQSFRKDELYNSLVEEQNKSATSISITPDPGNPDIEHLEELVKEGKLDRWNDGSYFLRGRAPKTDK